MTDSETTRLIIVLAHTNIIVLCSSCIIIIFSAMGLAFGKKFTEEEKLAVMKY